jgi:ubiquinone/menaquinone biosynthesis C-methylase UbiE
MASGRNSVWQQVWTIRDDDRADWNGFEACFESIDQYERWTQHIADILCAGLRLTSNDVVADIGCGTGRVATLIAPHVQQVLAFDYAPTLIRIASERRPRSNIAHVVADMTKLQPEALGVSKAYAVGSLFYLDSVADAFGVIKRFVEHGAAFAAIDLPDRNSPEQRGRSYDTSVYSHLDFDADELTAEFPSARIVRDDYPDYVNAAFRFHAFVEP